MARKKTERTERKSTAPANAPATSAPIVVFPKLSAKIDLVSRVLLEDQILLIDVRCGSPLSLFTSKFMTAQGLLSPAECKDFVKFIDSLPLELTPPKKRGEAERVNRKSCVTYQLFHISIIHLLYRSLFYDICGLCGKVACSSRSTFALVSPPSIHEIWVCGRFRAFSNSPFSQ